MCLGRPGVWNRTGRGERSDEDEAGIWSSTGKPGVRRGTGRRERPRPTAGLRGRGDLVAVGTLSDLTIRPVEPGDAGVCHELRRRAFLEVFSQFMDETLTAAGAEAYSASEFSQHLTDMPTAVAVAGGEIVGFCTVRRRDEREAELLWLYVRLEHLRHGIGSRLARHAEELVQMRFPDVSRIVLVTGVPEYNQAFYEHLGYAPLGTEEVAYPAASAIMVKMGKDIPEVEAPIA